MTNFITSLSNWLTNSHSIDLLGWQWIIFGGLTVVISAVIFIGGAMFLAKSLDKIICLPW